MAANGTFDTVVNSNGFPSRGDFGNSFLKISTHNGKLASTLATMPVIASIGAMPVIGHNAPMEVRP